MTELFEILICLAVIIFMLGLALIPLAMLFEETETFNAIDEKIAEIIRGKEE